MNVSKKKRGKKENAASVLLRRKERGKEINGSLQKNSALSLEKKTSAREKKETKKSGRTSREKKKSWGFHFILKRKNRRSVTIAERKA